MREDASYQFTEIEKVEAETNSGHGSLKVLKRERKNQHQVKNTGFLDNVCLFSMRRKKLTHVIRVNRFRRARGGGADSSGTSNPNAIWM